MKKLSVVVLVLSLVSMVTYGEDLWRRVGAGSEICPVSTIEYVGIGTETPNYPLEVVGETHITGLLRQLNGNVSLATGGNYKVGIGTTSPGEKLEVNGNLKISGNSYFGNNVSIQDSKLSVGGSGIGGFAISGIGYGSGYQGGIYAEGDFYDFYAGNSSGLSYFAGKVGIGTASPSEKLHVAGTVLMNGFKLPTGAANGYVLTSNGSGVGTWQALSGGLWSQNGSDIYYNNGNVGIGTASPGAKLDVNGEIRSGGINPYLWFYDTDTGEEYKSQYVIGRDGYLLVQAYNGSNWATSMILWPMTQYFPGNVGIGTTSPNGRLNVNGDIRVGLITDDNGGSPGYGDRLYFSGGDDWSSWDSDNSDPIWMARYNSASDESQLRINVGDWADAGDKIELGTTSQTGEWTPGMVVRADGNVGIGTTNPQSKLAVNGTITAREIIVTTDGWSDFVFSDNYKLMPLNKLEKYIRVNKSLPGVPKEKEVVKEGVALGEMQAKLLQKVEELTMYVIELKKENEGLKKTNENLERRISALEK